MAASKYDKIGDDRLGLTWEEDDFYSGAGGSLTVKEPVSKFPNSYTLMVVDRMAVDIMDYRQGRRSRVELLDGTTLKVSQPATGKQVEFQANGSGPATIRSLVEFAPAEAVNQARMFLLEKWRNSPEYGSTDIGEVKFTTTMLDTEMDVNPHKGTGIGMYQSDWPSETNNWRVHNGQE